MKGVDRAGHPGEAGVHESRNRPPHSGLHIHGSPGAIGG